MNTASWAWEAVVPALGSNISRKARSPVVLHSLLVSFTFFGYDMLSTSLLSLLFMAVLARTAPLTGSRNDTVSATAKRQSAGPGWIPFYGKSANLHSSNVRGWNTFGLQANKEVLYPIAGFDFNAYHFQRQCEQMVVRQGYDYVCSLDSGWSKDGGDPHGRFEPSEQVFSWFSDGIKGLSNELQKSNIKLGIYLLPGAFESDRDAIVEVR